MARRPVLEGFQQSIVGGIRSFFARSPEHEAFALRQGGVPSVERAGLPYNLVSQFGYDTLAEHLRIDQDLQARYTDYEEMDEYPEIQCLAGDSLVFTLRCGWCRIEDLARSNEPLWVLSYDRSSRSLVPAQAFARLSAPQGHAKQMVRVTLDNGSQVTCTDDHPFLTKGEEWVHAGELVAGTRLMPGALRLRHLTDEDSGVYWQVHQPHSDSEIRSTDGKRWVWLHRLVAWGVLGVEPGSGEIVHHEDQDQLNNEPGNLSVESRSSHADIHIAGIDNSRFFPSWTDERRAKHSERMRGNAHSLGAVRSDEHREAIGRAQRGRPKTAEHRRNIGLAQPNRVEVSRAELEAALEQGTVADAARALGVSWSTAKRKAVEYDLLSPDANHKVVKVERLDERPPVYDLMVPGFENFVCQGVVVHNTALDIYADDATIPNMDRGETIWVSSDADDVAKDLNDVLHKKLRIEDDVWGNCRTVAKYGNSFGELLVSEQGLVGINYLPAPTVRRVEDPKGSLLGFVQDTRGEFNISLEDFYQLAKQRNAGGDLGRAPGELTVFEDWEIVHWRLRSKHLRSVYGHGVAEPARWIWKRLALLEDAMLIYKLSRAPSRYAFYVDVGEMDNQRGLAFVNRVKNQFAKKKFVNPTTGKLDMRYNPLCLAGDTEVHLLDGSSKTIVEMVTAHEAGKEQWVWGADLDDSGRVRPVKVEWAGKTRRDAQLVRVTFDNGRSIRVTPDHKMIRRSGEKVEAQDLAPGDSLMPFRRRVSSKAKGEALDGYELVYCPQAAKSRYGHRIVAFDLGLSMKGQVVHHCDFDPLNNDPRNLVGMNPKEHRALHVRFGHSGGRAVAELRKVDADLDARLREASSNNMTAYNQSAERRKKVAGWNRGRDQARFIRAYNESPKHEADNEARSAAMTAFWEDSDRRAAASASMQIKFPLAFVEGVRQLVRSNPDASMEAIAEAATDMLLDELREANTRVIRSVHRHMLRKLVKAEGYRSFVDFKADAIDDNCKVVSVEWLDETEDTYTLTVKPCHTFGLSTGVFVCNSHDEDFFIPTRGGKDSTRIEVLQGPDYSETDTVEYHRDKLVSALKVPKCLVGETMVPLASGETATMEEIHRRFAVGEDMWTFSLDATGHVVPGKILGAQITGRQAELYEVELDHGEVVTCTPEHPFMLRSGKYRQAKDLREGDSLMPFLAKVNAKGYLKVFDPRLGRYENFHQTIGFMQYEGWYGRDGLVAHHENEKKLDNRPTNIQVVPKGKHQRDHVLKRGTPLVEEHARGKLREVMATDSYRERASEAARRRWSDPEYREKNLAKLVERNRSQKMRDVTADRNRRRVAVGKNHKVVTIRSISRRADVYDIEVEGHHNFALEAGIFVHNSYMGYGGEASRSALSSEDIRFARTVMRIQREIRAGYRKGCRVHLVAAGADADKYDYDVHMSVPSQILELAKLEVMSATADLASRMQETVSSRWILVHLFKFSEEDAAKLMAEKEEEALMKAESEGKAQAIIARAQEEAGPDAGLGPEAPPPEGGGQEQPKQESILREARAMRMAANSLNARLKRVEDWQREFDRKPKSQWAAEDQVERILKSDATTFKRLREIGGMVNEIRGQLR